MKKIILLLFAFQITNAQEYKPNWESLKNYEAPEWYEDAKLGFWVTWGVYSVPAFKGDHAAEWYGRWMYSEEGQSSRDNQGLATHLHHKKKYGDPNKFGYKDLIPLFKAENFDADEWADLCVKGGAKFFTMMGAHHDSFCLWDTKLSIWNSVNMGPKRDIVGEVEKAVRSRGLKFGVSNHTAWNYTFFQWNHINGYDANNKLYEDLYGNPIIPKQLDTASIKPNETRKSWLKRSRWGTVKPSERDLTRWIDRTKELADLYKPDLYYFDWGNKYKEFESRNQEFGAFYYNQAIELGKGVYGSPNVVLNYKNRIYPKGSAVRDFERGAFDDIADMVWQTDDSVYDDHNWGYAEGIRIKPTNAIVDQLMDIISKKGVLMLSFAPKPDGTFPEDQKKMIYELGQWLDICGEAVYATRPYEIFGEKSKKPAGNYPSGYKKPSGNSDDIRFTRNKKNTVLYATVLDWPGEVLKIKSLKRANLSTIKRISLLGVDEKLNWKITENGLEVKLPKKPRYNFAYPVKIEFQKEIPSIGNN